MAKIGDRVGAILSSDDKHVYFLGYGTYVGDRIPTDDVTFMGVQHNKYGRENPAIELDNGDVVYGCECWWGSETVIKNRLEKGGLKIQEVRIDKYRQEALATRDEEG